MLACSALKIYRETRVGSPGSRWSISRGFELIRERLRQRTGHFMKDSMLASQFAALEEPTEGDRCRRGGSLDEIVRTIVAAL